MALRQRKAKINTNNLNIGPIIWKVCFDAKVWTFQKWPHNKPKMAKNASSSLFEIIISTDPRRPLHYINRKAFILVLTVI